MPVGHLIFMLDPRFFEARASSPGGPAFPRAAASARGRFSPKPSNLAPKMKTLFTYPLLTHYLGAHAEVPFLLFFS